jgi:hypothetical protein
MHSTPFTSTFDDPRKRKSEYPLSKRGVCAPVQLVPSRVIAIEYDFLVGAPLNHRFRLRSAHARDDAIDDRAAIAEIASGIEQRVEFA